MSGADVDNDGTLEIVFVELLAGGNDERIHVVGFDGSEIPGQWPVRARWRRYSSTTLMDLDGNGKMEVLSVASDDPPETDFTEVRVLDHRGRYKTGWPLQLARSSGTGAAVGDLDLDGDHEIIVVTYVGYWGNGWIYVYHHDGTRYADGPFFSKVPSQTVLVPPSLVDLAGDPHPEIVVADHDNGGIHVYDWEGDVVPGWPAVYGGIAVAMPAAFDVDRNGQVDGLWAASWKWSLAYDRQGNLLPNFPWTGLREIDTQVAIADLDGVSMLEAFIGGSEPDIWALEFDGTVVESWPRGGNSSNWGSGTITDLDEDGDTDIVFGSDDGNIYVFDTPGIYDHQRIECATWMYDNWHTGAYHKDIYREVESANEKRGWVSRPDTSAWGHRILRPDGLVHHPTEASPQSSSSANIESFAPTDGAPGAIGARRQRFLCYRTEVPVWREYTLWIRLHRSQASSAWPVATMDGVPLEGAGATADSPGRWLWYSAGHRDLKQGIHELDIRVSGTGIELDRWLLTTHDTFPLMAERPHAW